MTTNNVPSRRRGYPSFSVQRLRYSGEFLCTSRVIRRTKHLMSHSSTNIIAVNITKVSSLKHKRKVITRPSVSLIGLKQKTVVDPNRSTSQMYNISTAKNRHVHSNCRMSMSGIHDCSLTHARTVQQASSDSTYLPSYIKPYIYIMYHKNISKGVRYIIIRFIGDPQTL